MPELEAWQKVIITGSSGIVIAALIFFTVRERARGSAEPEMEEALEYTSSGFADMQDAADATVFSAATAHARGMNTIALINLVMAAVLADVV